jgi:hypothetical protein
MSLLLTFTYVTSTSRWPYNACLSRRSKLPYGGLYAKRSIPHWPISRATLRWTRPTMVSWVAEKQDHQVCESSVKFLSLLSRIGQATANLLALCRFTAAQRLYKSIIDLPALSDYFSLRIDCRVHSWVLFRSKFVCSQVFVKIPEFRIGGVVEKLINGILSDFVAVLHRAFAQVICQRVCWCQSLRDWKSGNVYCSKKKQLIDGMVLYFHTDVDYPFDEYMLVKTQSDRFVSASVAKHLADQSEWCLYVRRIRAKENFRDIGLQHWLRQWRVRRRKASQDGGYGGESESQERWLASWNRKGKPSGQRTFTAFLSSPEIFRPRMWELCSRRPPGYGRQGPNLSFIDLVSLALRLTALVTLRDLWPRKRILRVETTQWRLLLLLEFQ